MYGFTASLGRNFRIIALTLTVLSVGSAWATDPQADASHTAAKSCLDKLSSNFDGLLKTQRCAVGALCHTQYTGCDPIGNAKLKCGAVSSDAELSLGSCHGDYQFNYGGHQEQLPKLLKRLGSTIDREDYFQNGSATTASSNTSNMSAPCRAAEGVARAGRMLKGESSWTGTQAREMDRHYTTASTAIGDDNSPGCNAALKGYANMDHVALAIQREVYAASTCLYNVARDIKQKNSCDSAFLSGDGDNTPAPPTPKAPDADTTN